MLETFIITFREGLEAFLIVAIITAYLIQTGRKQLLEPVAWGVVVAVMISLTTGWHIAELAQQPVMEGALAITAGFLVASMTYVMIKNAKNIKVKISENLEKSASQAGIKAALGVFVFTVVMITREGMETAMMLGAMSSTMNTGNLVMGVFMGVLAVAVIGFLWIQQSDRINLKLFMQVTGVFLMLFCIHLLVYGFHELTEASVVPLIDNFYWHTLTEPLEPSEPIGKAITVLMLAIPCAWLLINYVREKLTNQIVFSAAE